MARKSTRSSAKAKADATPKDQPKADEKVAQTAADTAAAPKPDAEQPEASAPAKDPTPETPSDAGADAELAIAASAPAPNDPRASDEGAEVSDASASESTQMSVEEKAALLNAAIAEVGKENLYEVLKGQLCDPAFEIEVVGPREGRWRAGRHFHREPTIIPAEELTFEEFTCIHQDTVLLVLIRPKAPAIEA